MSIRNSISSPIMKKKLKVKTIEWEYFIFGIGKETLLVFPGGLRQPLFTVDLFQPITSKYRILIPSYPRIYLLKELVEGIVAILNEEQIDKTHLLGSSFGGIMAQAFVSYYPERVLKIILGNTGTQTNDQEWIKKLTRGQRIISFLPGFFLRRQMQKQFVKLVPKNVENYETIVNSIKIHIQRKKLDKKDLICHYKSLLDFQVNVKLPNELVSAIQEKLLIITSENDPGTSSTAVQNLKEKYPKAKFYNFEAGNHMPILTNTTEYLALIENFLMKNV